MLCHYENAEVHLGDLIDLANDMPPMAGCTAPAPQGSPFDFSAHAGQETPGLHAALVTPIHAGGEGEATRWSKFSQVCGHYYHCVREGKITLAEADAMVRGWVAANMIPPWPDARVTQEMRGLAIKDVAARGPFELPGPVATPPCLPSITDSVALTEIPEWARATGTTKASPFTRINLDDWSVGRLVEREAPLRRHLVQGIIQALKSHIMAAEGGAGKTAQAEDLGLKLAVCGDDWTDLSWWGQRVIPATRRYRVVMVTSEDDEEEMHTRRVGAHASDTLKIGLVMPSGETCRRVVGSRPASSTPSFGLNERIQMLRGM